MSVVGQVADFVAGFPPYSDFNAASLWAWDVGGGTTLSRFNDELVIRFPGYGTNAPGGWSIFGARDVAAAANALFDAGAEELRLVPQCVVENLPPDRFSIREDLDSHDYVYDLDRTTNLDAPAWRSKRRYVSRFNRRWPLASVTTVRQLDHTLTDEIFGVFDRWAERRPSDDSAVQTEYAALARLLSFRHQFSLLVTVIRVERQAVAFSVDQPLGSGWAVGHFTKVDPSFPDANTVIWLAAANRLHELGVRTLNTQQDLGLSGLRQSKLSWHPSSYLKKYSVARHPSDGHER